MKNIMIEMIGRNTIFICRTTNTKTHNYWWWMTIILWWWIRWQVRRLKGSLADEDLVGW